MKKKDVIGHEKTEKSLTTRHEKIKNKAYGNKCPKWNDLIEGTLNTRPRMKNFDEYVCVYIKY